MNEKNDLVLKEIKNKIYTIRGVQVILDSDLAEFYQVETKRLNEQVKRNILRFPESFCFQLRENEYQNLKSQFATSSLGYGGKRKLPLVFTEAGVAMLAGVLKSRIAIQISIQIINTFISLRKIFNSNILIDQRLSNIERKHFTYDENFEKIFTLLENPDAKRKQGVFYDSQIFDSHVFISDLIKSAKKEIILLDNYIDETTLFLFNKREKEVKVIIYTKNLTENLKQDLEKYNSQYEKIEIKEFTLSHDRFLIIDKKEIYHIGASLKDLGKKWFGFSKLDKENLNILERI